jgi:hypothetical protein
MPWTVEQTVEFYKSFANDYDKDVDETYPAPVLIGRWVTDYLSLHTETVKSVFNILDGLQTLTAVGCGTGQSSKPFFKHPQHDRFKGKPHLTKYSGSTHRRKCLPRLNRCRLKASFAKILNQRSLLTANSTPLYA